MTYAGVIYLIMWKIQTKRIPDIFKGLIFFHFTVSKDAEIPVGYWQRTGPECDSAGSGRGMPENY